MSTQAEKTPENKNWSLSLTNSQKQNVSESDAQFTDNRAETSMQRNLQVMANTGSHSSHAVQLQAIASSYSNNIIQAKGIEDEETLQGKFNTIQKQSMEEEEMLQGKFETVQKKRNETGLPDNLKSGIENQSGISIDDVKVHFNSDKPAQLNAHAYAQGTDIHVAPGQEKHLPHEAWHVVQQKQGRVKPTMQMKGKVNVNDDEGLENEADVMGEKALQLADKQPELVQRKSLLKLNSSDGVKQLNGDRYYWVRPNGGVWTYVGSFKNHASANTWWANNKATYPGGEFSQGSTKTKFK